MPVRRRATRVLYRLFNCRSTAVNASIAVAFDRPPASSGRAPGMPEMIYDTVSVARRWSEQTNTSLASSWSRLPSSVAGT